MKELNITINKSVNGYTVYDNNQSVIDYFNDDDEGRKELVRYLVDNVFNNELKDGRKYI